MLPSPQTRALPMQASEMPPDRISPAPAAWEGGWNRRQKPAKRQSARRPKDHEIRVSCQALRRFVAAVLPSTRAPKGFQHPGSFSSSNEHKENAVAPPLCL